METSIFFF